LRTALPRSSFRIGRPDRPAILEMSVKTNAIRTAAKFRVMQRTFSIYLDLARVSAALAVLLGHWKQNFDVALPLPLLGKDAVIVFFVVSGFVVAYAADQKDGSLSEYLFNRTTRLYSVMIPAFVMGSLLLFVEHRQESWAYFENQAYVAFMNLLFLSQAGGLDLSPDNNNPMWSVGYEALFYLLYACIFVKNKYFAIVLGAILAVISGIKIVILLPCWLAGIALYHFRHSLRVSAGAGRCLLLISVLAYSIYFFGDVNAQLRKWAFTTEPVFMGSLQYSNRFIGDYLFTSIFVFHLIAIMSLESVLQPFLGLLEPIVRAFARRTFSIYLYHGPLMTYTAYALVPRDASLGLKITILFLILGAIWALAEYTELRLSGFRRRCRSGMARLRVAA